MSRLPTNVGEFGIAHEKFISGYFSSSSRTRRLPTYRTFLVDANAGTRYLSHVRLPDDPWFEALFRIKFSPASGKNLDRYLLHSRDFEDGRFFLQSEEWLGKQLGYTLEIHLELRKTLLKTWCDTIGPAGARKFGCYVEHQGNLFNAICFALFQRFLDKYSISSPALDEAPLLTGKSTPEVERWLDGVVASAGSEPAFRATFLYFCPFVVSDLLTFVPFWYQLAFRLMRCDWTKLVQLTAMFWRDPGIFCFDDPLTQHLAPLKLPIVLARGHGRDTLFMSAAESAASSASLEENAGADDALGTELLDDFEDATQRRKTVADEERQKAMWPQGDDYSFCKIRVMSAWDIQALCNSIGDTERFKTLRDVRSQIKAIEGARIFQYACDQLRVGNNYINDAILSKLHDRDQCGHMWSQRDVMDETVQRLEELGVVRVFRLKNSEQTRCMALPHVWDSETWLFRWFQEKIQLEYEDRTSGTNRHPFARMQEHEQEWRAECENEFLLYPAQVHAVSNILTRRISILSGPPGSGKTFTLSRAFAVIAKAGIKYDWQVATPTCKSRKQLEAELRRAKTEVGDDQVCTAQFLITRAKTNLALMRKEWQKKVDALPEGATRPREPTFEDVRIHVNVLAIDEASMWSSTLLRDLLAVVTCDVFICTGDLDQCTPIAWGRPLHVFVDFEREINQSLHLCMLDQIRRNSGDVAMFGQSIRTNNLNPLIKIDDRGCSEVVTWARNRDELHRLLTASNNVIAVDDRLALPGLNKSNYMIAIGEINAEMHRRADDIAGPVGSPPVHVVTYSSAEMTSVNAYCQDYRRALGLWRKCAIRGDVTIDNFDSFVPSKTAQCTIIQSKEAAAVRNRWSLAVGDYVYCTRNMKKLFEALVESGVNKNKTGLSGCFYKHWADRFTKSKAPSWGNMQTIELQDGNGYVSNGDTGLVVQMFILDLTFRCHHPKTKFDEICPLCPSAAAGMPIMCGKTWAMRSLVGHATRDNLKEWRISADSGVILMAVLWLEATGCFIHVPIPIYPPAAIEPGYALTFFRCQGSQWETVVFLCSNSHRAQGDQYRNAYQKMMERQYRRAVEGRFNTDSYWQNRRTTYVACTRARRNLVLLTSIPWNHKLMQLLEHTSMPPNVLEEYFSNNLEPPEVRPRKRSSEEEEPTSKSQRTDYDDDDGIPDELLMEMQY